MFSGVREFSGFVAKRSRKESPKMSKLRRNDSFGSSNTIDDSSMSSINTEDDSSTKISSLSDFFPACDEDASDFYFEDESTFRVTKKLDNEVFTQFEKSFGMGTIPMGLGDAMKSAAPKILDLAEDEPYGIRGARIIVKFKTFNNIDEETILGHFSMDRDTVSTFEVTLTLEQEPQLSISIRNWLGQITGSGHAIQISPKVSLRKRSLYRSGNFRL